MTFEEIVREARQLPLTQQRQLIEIIVDSILETRGLMDQTYEKTHSILEFEGVGAHVRDDIDPQDHVNQLRSEWEDRP